MKRSLTSLQEKDKFDNLKGESRSVELAPKRQISTKVGKLLNVFKQVFHQSNSSSPKEEGSNFRSKFPHNLSQTSLQDERRYFSVKNDSVQVNKRDVTRQVKSKDTLNNLSTKTFQKDQILFGNLDKQSLADDDVINSDVTIEQDECLTDTNNLSQVSISDVILAWLRFKTAVQAKTEKDCLKRILCEMNSIVSWRNSGSPVSSMFAQLGTFAILQHQNVLGPNEDLLRAARTGRQLERAGNCQRIYDSCSSWDQIAHAAELLWIPFLKKN